MELFSEETDRQTDSKHVFYIQKEIIGMMADIKRTASCRELFEKFNILALTKEVLPSLLLFVHTYIQIITFLGSLGM